MKIGDKVVCIKESGKFVLNERAEIMAISATPPGASLIVHNPPILESQGGLSDIFFIRCHNTGNLGIPFMTEDFHEHFMSLEDWREKQLEQIICISE
jgi:hypothetical protein